MDKKKKQTPLSPSSSLSPTSDPPQPLTPLRRLFSPQPEVSATKIHAGAARSVRRPLVVGGDDLRGSFAASSGGKIGSCLRKSRAGLLAKARPALPVAKSSRASKEDKVDNKINWRQGEMIGCGAYGRVYKGTDLDSGKLLAVKQVSIPAASKHKAQTHIRELEEEAKLLKHISHPNIVRCLGTAIQDETFNILLEFVPGGSISSLLEKFGSFPEEEIRRYTKQLLEGLEYLHHNRIIHGDIKGANILVDIDGRIKLADFGASKQVVELATVSGAKSLKGTTYWMAPEVIRQTGHTFSADIWSVGCTVIEMATGKPPWSQQYQEVAALYHIGTTKSHPPIPDHLSFGATDFLLKCLRKEPNERPSASDLLQFMFPCRPRCEEEEEVTEQKIIEFLVEKAAELKRMPSALFEFYMTSSTPVSGRVLIDNNGAASSSNLPPKSKSPNRRGEAVKLGPLL